MVNVTWASPIYRELSGHRSGVVKQTYDLPVAGKVIVCPPSVTAEIW